MPDLDFNLHKAQLDIFKSPKRFKVVPAGRRFGKSHLSAVELIIECLKDNKGGFDLKGKDVWYIAPTFQQGKEIMWRLLKDLGRDVISGAYENTATLTLINGRRIAIKGADRPDTLRGVALSYVVLDEYASMKPEVWEQIIRPTLADVKGGALFIGTPAGKNHFYELYLAAQDQEDWDTFHFNSTDNPFLPKDEIENARETLSSNAFRQEFEASFEAQGGGIFKEEYIKYGEEPKDGFWYVSVDPAGFEEVKGKITSKLKKLDECAISIVKIHKDGWYVKDILSGRWGVRETALKIIRACQSVHSSRCGIESGSLKNALGPYLEDTMRRIGVYPTIDPVSHGRIKKTERIAWALEGRFEHGRITLRKADWNKKFISQLLDFPNPLAHDDLIDSLAYIDQVGTTNYDSYIEFDEPEILDIVTGM